MLSEAKSGAEMGAGFRLFGGGAHDPSEKPREDTHPANEPVKQPDILKGTGRDGTQTGDAAHIERQSAASKASEANKRDMGGSAKPDPTAGGSSQPTSPVADPDIKAAADAANATPKSKDQQASPVQQSGVAQPPPGPAPRPPEAPQAGDTTAPPPPPPAGAEAGPLPRSHPRLRRFDPAALAQQHAELNDPNRTAPRCGDLPQAGGTA